MGRGRSTRPGARRARGRRRGSTPPFAARDSPRQSTATGPSIRGAGLTSNAARPTTATTLCPTPSPASASQANATEAPDWAANVRRSMSQFHSRAGTPCRSIRGAGLTGGDRERRRGGGGALRALVAPANNTTSPAPRMGAEGRQSEESRPGMEAVDCPSSPAPRMEASGGGRAQRVESRPANGSRQGGRALSTRLPFAARDSESHPANGSRAKGGRGGGRTAASRPRTPSLRRRRRPPPPPAPAAAPARHSRRGTRRRRRGRRGRRRGGGGRAGRPAGAVPSRGGTRRYTAASWANCGGQLGQLNWVYYCAKPRPINPLFYYQKAELLLSLPKSLPK